jgi:hypothetical protein
MLMIAILVTTCGSGMVIHEEFRKHWMTAAIAAGLIRWDTIVPYIQHSISLCSIPIFKHIRCCSPGFNISEEPGLLLPRTAGEVKCGFASEGSCQPPGWAAGAAGVKSPSDN